MYLNMWSLCNLVMKILLFLTPDGVFFKSTTFTITLHKQLANGLTIIKGYNDIITFLS